MRERVTMWMCRIAFLGMLLGLVMPASAVTTASVSAIPTVEQAVSTYDVGSMHVTSSRALTGSNAAATPVPFFDSVAGLVAAKGLATGTDEAVFWTGIRNGESTAATWVSQNSGATLETTMATRGVKLPPWDANNPVTVAAWRSASAEFAAGARGNIRVLQSDTVRLKSVWAEVEWPALKANPNVTSITAVNPETGVQTLLWKR